METNVGDILHCEEQLRTTLHCVDKDKLRRKLAQLQREYLRTAQRLQRAERSDAVRRHVRSRIVQQNRQAQKDPEVTSNPCLNTSSLTLNTSNATVPSVPRCQGRTEAPVDSDNGRRSQVIRFLLPSDADCQQTPDSSHDAARGDRPSPALRLRSRRSRLRWERRSAEAGRSTDSSEKGLEQGERMESGGTAEEEQEKVKSERTDVVNESEELFSGTESESPSLLLTHWNTHGYTETGNTEGKEIQGQQEQREKETELRAEGKEESEPTSLLLTCSDPALTTKERGQDGTQYGRREMESGEDGENSREQKEMRLCEESRHTDSEQNAPEKIESEEHHDGSVEVEEENNGMIGGGKGASLRDSCTLVEGLLFPAEYYVRTTRRMTLSQSQPDMQAVILSQLSIGQRRRSRGRGRGMNRNTHTGEPADQKGFSSLTTASSSADPHKPPHVQAVDASAEHNRSTGEISDSISDGCFSPAVTPARPARGRRRKRGRGRASPQTPQSSLCLDTHQLGCEQTSDAPPPTITPISSSQSLHGVDGPKPCPTPGETVLVPDEPHSTASQPSSGVNGALSSSAAKHLEKVYPIFLKSSDKSDRSSQTNRSTSSWRSLLLPSSPPGQTSLCPLPSLSSGPLVNSLMNLDSHQDFHLPDEQFAFLKLHKLRQVSVESGVEHLSSPSYHTRSSNRRSDPRCSGRDPVMPLPLPLSLTPTIVNLPHPDEEQQAATRSTDLSEVKITDELINQPLAEELCDIAENNEERQTENPHAEINSSSTEPVSVVQECADDCGDKEREVEAVTLNNQSQDSISASSTHTSVNNTDKPPQPHLSFADSPAGNMNDYVIGHSDEQPASEERANCCGVVQPLEDQRPKPPQAEDRTVSETLSFDRPLQETPEEPSNHCAALEACNDTKAAGESPVMHLNVKPAKHSEEPSEPDTNLSADRLIEDKTTCLLHHSVLSSPLASAPCPLVTPHLPSATLPSSPTLPSLGLTPHPVTGSLPLTSSPSAPPLTLPPPPSPSTQAPSPCPSITFLPPSLPPLHQIQASVEPPSTGDRCHGVEPPACPPPSSIQLQCPGGQVGQTREETAEEHTIRPIHTLKAAAGGFLVDACCLSGSSGSLCVAAAGKWAVCLWSQTLPSDWSLIHTWTFNEPVINVFPVPDAAGLMCVTLGQLEIREVRLLSCSSLMQMLFCEGIVQAVVAVSKSRVVTSSHSATGSTLRVFVLSDNSSSPSSQALGSPGVCVGALAPVEGLSDALIGTDEGEHLFIWNLKTGQLLRSVLLGDGLSHTACLRGYSYCGVLFVLLQHQFLSSLEEEEKGAKIKDEMFSEEEMKTALFSLVAFNPLSGKSALATRLYPPKAWSGRLCEADIKCSSVVGLSQDGCVCVWELGQPGGSRMVWAPESEGWQLARWGGGDTLVTGHHNGDVTLHCYSASHSAAKNTDSQMEF